MKSKIVIPSNDKDIAFFWRVKLVFFSHLNTNDQSALYHQRDNSKMQRFAETEERRERKHNKKPYVEPTAERGGGGGVV